MTTRTERVDAIVVAAGRSSRMGGTDKLTEWLGDRPLIDELSPHQSAALLPALLVWLRARFVPGTEGLVLYTRLLYFGFGLLIWRELHRSLRGPFWAEAALLVEVACPRPNGRVAWGPVGHARQCPPCLDSCQGPSCVSA